MWHDKIFESRNLVFGFVIFYKYSKMHIVTLSWSAYFTFQEKNGLRIVHMHPYSKTIDEWIKCLSAYLECSFCRKN